MKRTQLSVFLFVTLSIALLVILALYGILVPWMARDLLFDFPEAAFLYIPCLLYAELSALPILAAILEGYCMTARFSKDRSFCRENIRALQRICIYGLVSAAWYLLGFILLVVVMAVCHWNMLIIALALLVLGVVSVCVACASAVASHLFRKASDLQEENELTI